MPLLFLGGAIATITILFKSKIPLTTERQNPIDASPELDFSRKKRIYIKRQQHAHKQTQLLKGTKDVKKYRKKKASGKKTESKKIEYRIGDKVFVQKIKLPTDRAKGLN